MAPSAKRKPKVAGGLSPAAREAATTALTTAVRARDAQYSGSESSTTHVNLPVKHPYELRVPVTPGKSVPANATHADAVKAVVESLRPHLAKVLNEQGCVECVRNTAPPKPPTEFHPAKAWSHPVGVGCFQQVPVVASSTVANDILAIGKFDETNRFESLQSKDVRAALLRGVSHAPALVKPTPKSWSVIVTLRSLGDGVLDLVVNKFAERIREARKTAMYYRVSNMVQRPVQTEDELLSHLLGLAGQSTSLMETNRESAQHMVGGSGKIPAFDSRSMGPSLDSLLMCEASAVYALSAIRVVVSLESQPQASTQSRLLAKPLALDALTSLGLCGALQGHSQPVRLEYFSLSASPRMQLRVQLFFGDEVIFEHSEKFFCSSVGSTEALRGALTRVWGAEFKDAQIAVDLPCTSSAFGHVCNAECDPSLAPVKRSEHEGDPVVTINVSQGDNSCVCENEGAIKALEVCRSEEAVSVSAARAGSMVTVPKTPAFSVPMTKVAAYELISAAERGADGNLVRRALPRGHELPPPRFEVTLSLSTDAIVRAVNNSLRKPSIGGTTPSFSVYAALATPAGYCLPVHATRVGTAGFGTSTSLTHVLDVMPSKLDQGEVEPVNVTIGLAPEAADVIDHCLQTPHVVLVLAANNFIAQRAPIEVGEDPLTKTLKDISNGRAAPFTDLIRPSDKVSVVSPSPLPDCTVTPQFEALSKALMTGRSRYSQFSLLHPARSAAVHSTVGADSVFVGANLELRSVKSVVEKALGDSVFAHAFLLLSPKTGISRADVKSLRLQVVEGCPPPPLVGPSGSPIGCPLSAAILPGTRFLQQDVASDVANDTTGDVQLLPVDPLMIPPYLRTVSGGSAVSGTSYHDGSTASVCDLTLPVGLSISAPRLISNRVINQLLTPPTITGSGDALSNAIGLQLDAVYDANDVFQSAVRRGQSPVETGVRNDLATTAALPESFRSSVAASVTDIFNVLSAIYEALQASRVSSRSDAVSKDQSEVVRLCGFILTTFLPIASDVSIFPHSQVTEDTVAVVENQTITSAALSRISPVLMNALLTQWSTHASVVARAEAECKLSELSIDGLKEGNEFRFPLPLNALLVLLKHTEACSESMTKCADAVNQAYEAVCGTMDFFLKRGRVSAPALTHYALCLANVTQSLATAKNNGVHGLRAPAALPTLLENVTNRALELCAAGCRGKVLNGLPHHVLHAAFFYLCRVILLTPLPLQVIDGIIGPLTRINGGKLLVTNTLYYLSIKGLDRVADPATHGALSLIKVLRDVTSGSESPSSLYSVANDALIVAGALVSSSLLSPHTDIDGEISRLGTAALSLGTAVDTLISFCGAIPSFLDNISSHQSRKFQHRLLRLSLARLCAASLYPLHPGYSATARGRFAARIAQVCDKMAGEQKSLPYSMASTLVELLMLVTIQAQEVCSEPANPITFLTTQVGGLPGRMLAQATTRHRNQQAIGTGLEPPAKRVRGNIARTNFGIDADLNVVASNVDVTGNYLGFLENSGAVHDTRRAAVSTVNSILGGFFVQPLPPRDASRLIAIVINSLAFSSSSWRSYHEGVDVSAHTGDLVRCFVLLIAADVCSGHRRGDVLLSPRPAPYRCPTARAPLHGPGSSLVDTELTADTQLFGTLPEHVLSELFAFVVSPIYAAFSKSDEDPPVSAVPRIQITQAVTQDVAACIHRAVVGPGAASTSRMLITEIERYVASTKCDSSLVHTLTAVSIARLRDAVALLRRATVAVHSIAAYQVRDVPRVEPIRVLAGLAAECRDPRFHQVIDLLAVTLYDMKNYGECAAALMAKARLLRRGLVDFPALALSAGIGKAEEVTKLCTDLSVLPAAGARPPLLCDSPYLPFSIVTPPSTPIDVLSLLPNLGCSLLPMFGSYHSRYGRDEKGEVDLSTFTHRDLARFSHFYALALEDRAISFYRRAGQIAPALALSHQLSADAAEGLSILEQLKTEAEEAIARNESAVGTTFVIDCAEGAHGLGLLPKIETSEEHQRTVSERHVELTMASSTYADVSSQVVSDFFVVRYVGGGHSADVANTSSVIRMPPAASVQSLVDRIMEKIPNARVFLPSDEVPAIPPDHSVVILRAYATESTDVADLHKFAELTADMEKARGKLAKDESEAVDEVIDYEDLGFASSAAIQISDRTALVNQEEYDPEAASARMMGGARREALARPVVLVTYEKRPLAPTVEPGTTVDAARVEEFNTSDREVKAFKIKQRFAASNEVVLPPEPSVCRRLYFLPRGLFTRGEQQPLLSSWAYATPAAACVQWLHAAQTAILPFTRAIMGASELISKKGRLTFAAVDDNFSNTGMLGDELGGAMPVEPIVACVDGSTPIMSCSTMLNVGPARILSFFAPSSETVVGLRRVLDLLSRHDERETSIEKALMLQEKRAFLKRKREAKEAGTEFTEKAPAVTDLGIPPEDHEWRVARYEAQRTAELVIEASEAFRAVVTALGDEVEGEDVENYAIALENAARSIKERL